MTLLSIISFEMILKIFFAGFGCGAIFCVGLFLIMDHYWGKDK